MPCKVGIVADVQYRSSAEEETEQYVDALDRLAAAVTVWQREGVVCVAQLGDIIDGGASCEESEADMDAVLQVLHPAAERVLHVVGNHCLVNNPRTTLHTQLGIPGSFFNRTQLAGLEGWVFVTLDTTELSLCGGGWGEEDVQGEEVREYLEARPLASAPEMKDYNGGVCAAQLRFLETSLAHCEEQGLRAIVLTHHPLHPACEGVASHLAWNHAAIRTVLTKHSNTVHAVLSGHFHPGAYTKDPCGIHYVVLKAMLLHHQHNAYGVLTFQDNGAVLLNGCGTAQGDILLD